jgi:hypothetical protein
MQELSSLLAVIDQDSNRTHAASPATPHSEAGLGTYLIDHEDYRNWRRESNASMLGVSQAPPSMRPDFPAL